MTDFLPIKAKDKNWMYPVNINELSHEQYRPSYNVRFTDDVQTILQNVYIVMALIWIFIVIITGMFRTDIIGLVILSVPIIVFSISASNVKNLTPELEELDMFQGNIHSFIFLIVIILINWQTPLNKLAKIKFLKIVVLSIVFIMLSLIDVWVFKEYIIIEKHIRTSFHTMGLVLLAYAVYEFYVLTAQKSLS